MQNHFLSGARMRLIAFLVLALSGFLAGPTTAQAPALPREFGADPRLTWRPTLNPTAAVTVDDQGVVTDWRGAAPVLVPAAGRVPLIVALELLDNDAGQWVGISGVQGAVKLGARTDKDESARPAGFSGISVVGLGDGPDGASIGGYQLANYVGRQSDLAFCNLTIDSWTNRPCTLAAHAHPDFGHLYLEDVDLLGIPNDLARPDPAGAYVDPAGVAWPTPKFDAATTWWFRHEGYAASHFLRVRSVGGAVRGDGHAGTSEHGVYQDGPADDSQFLDCYFHGCQISALYFPTRFADRIVTGAGVVVAERIGRGRLLIDGLFAHDCGVNGSFAVNVCGGLLDVEVRDYRYRVNLDGYALSGQAPGAKWAGGALQVYCDHKAWELLPPISSQSKPVALGYSLESGVLDANGDPLPMSDGVQALVDAGTIPWDGYGGARSLLVVGGSYEVSNLTPPLFSLRDVRLVSIQQGAADTVSWRVVGLGAGKVLHFAGTGVRSQCGPAQAPGAPSGALPPSLGSTWNQQARFLSRLPPAAWLGGGVRVNGQGVSGADLATWRWRP